MLLRASPLSTDGDWSGWCRFFLEGVRHQAQENTQKARAILELYEELKPRVTEWTHSQYAILALDWLFGRPIFKSTDFISGGPTPEATARRLLKAFKKLELVREVSPSRGRKPAVLTFPRLLNIAEGREMF